MTCAAGGAGWRSAALLAVFWHQGWHVVAQDASSPTPPSQQSAQCLIYRGNGCGSIRNKEACLQSRDGRPFDYLDGRRVSGEPCVWCGGGNCTGDNDHVCAPYGWLGSKAGYDGAGSEVANCADLRTLGDTLKTLPTYGQDLPPATVAFQSLGADVACRGVSSSNGTGQHQRLPYSIWTASTLQQCESRCTAGCLGIEFNAVAQYCEVWWDLVGSSVEKSGFNCFRKLTDCLTPKDNGCSQLTSSEQCLSSKDGRESVQLANTKIRVYGSPCIWCGGGACMDKSAAVCEPVSLLVEDYTHSSLETGAPPPAGLDEWLVVGDGYRVAGCGGDGSVPEAQVPKGGLFQHPAAGFVPVVAAPGTPTPVATVPATTLVLTPSPTPVPTPAPTPTVAPQPALPDGVPVPVEIKSPFAVPTASAGMTITRCHCDGCDEQGRIKNDPYLVYGTKSATQSCIKMCQATAACKRIYLHPTGCALYDQGANNLTYNPYALGTCWVQAEDCVTNNATNCGEQETSASTPAPIYAPAAISVTSSPIANFPSALGGEAGGERTQKFSAAVELRGATALDKSALSSSIALATGVDAGSVSIGAVKATTQASIGFDDVLTSAQVQQIVALACGVSMDNVTVSQSSIGTLPAMAGRRLADQEHYISIAANDAAQAFQIQTVVGDVSQLSNAQAQIVPNASVPLVTAAPTILFLSEVGILANKEIPTPTPQVLQAAVSQTLAGNAQVVSAHMDLLSVEGPNPSTPTKGVLARSKAFFGAEEQKIAAIVMVVLLILVFWFVYHKSHQEAYSQKRGVSLASSESELSSDEESATSARRPHFVKTAKGGAVSVGNTELARESPTSVGPPPGDAFLQEDIFLQGSQAFAEQMRVEPPSIEAQRSCSSLATDDSGLLSPANLGSNVGLFGLPLPPVPDMWERLNSVFSSPDGHQSPPTGSLDSISNRPRVGTTSSPTGSVSRFPSHVQEGPAYSPLVAGGQFSPIPQEPVVPEHFVFPAGDRNARQFVFKASGDDVGVQPPMRLN